MRSKKRRIEEEGRERKKIMSSWKNRKIGRSRKRRTEEEGKESKKMKQVKRRREEIKRERWSKGGKEKQMEINERKRKE